LKEKQRWPGEKKITGKSLLLKIIIAIFLHGYQPYPALTF